MSDRKTNSLIVFDSAFGNTEAIARAIAEAMTKGGEARADRADGLSARDLRGVDLLIVGSPTQGFRPTKPVTDLLDSLPHGGLDGISVAAFDTRINVADIDSRLLRFMVDKGGYAAKHIADRLVRAGGRLAAPAEGFFVADKEGPVRPGELDRAKAWAETLARGFPTHWQRGEPA